MERSSLATFLPVWLILIATTVLALPTAQEERLEKWGTGKWPFSGLPTFGHLPHAQCLISPETQFDIAIVGAPFDSGATYRPGARLGPRAVRAASCRHMSSRGFNPVFGINPYQSHLRVMDCDDIPIDPTDVAAGLVQMTEAFTDLLSRQPISSDLKFPRLVVLGGDHLISLPVLRAVRSVYGSPIRVLHFDSHLDTLSPAVYPSTQASPQSHYNHGTVLWHAAAEGLLDSSGSVHVGTNTRLSGDNWSDYEVDTAAGFVRIPASAIDDQGSAGIIRAIKDILPDGTRIYLSIDIDVLDPAFAPGTGAPEPGGWSTRELLSVLRGVLPNLDVIAADVVEVAPAYDNPGGDTAFAAAGLVYEVISAMVARIVTNTTRPTSGSRAVVSNASKIEL